MDTEQEWIDAQGECCIESCTEKPSQVDNMDNVYCDEHAEQDQLEDPGNWD